MTNLSDTQPTKIQKRSRAGFLIGLLVLTAALVFGSFGGYQWGIGDRRAAAQSIVSQALGEQFEMAQQDFEARRLDIARQRLEYILQRDTAFPGAAELLSQVLVQMAITPSPTITPTPTMTPTPDLREQSAIYEQIKSQMAASDWDGAIASMDSLRKKDITYQAAEIDGMYFMALRNRGVAKILGQAPYNPPILEGGIYDLTLAERFGPIDGQAAGLRNFARMYIQGASNWELDWGQAVNIFGDLYIHVPNLRDGSNITATERYRIALLRFGDDFNEKYDRIKDRCLALNQWDKAAEIAPLDAQYAGKYNALWQECFPPTPTPEPFTPTPEVVPTEETTEEPAPEP
ncbi:MAG: hypothetical protein R6W69_08655 [Anaerolineales bacterium]